MAALRPTQSSRLLLRVLRRLARVGSAGPPVVLLLALLWVGGLGVAGCAAPGATGPDDPARDGGASDLAAVPTDGPVDLSSAGGDGCAVPCGKLCCKGAESCNTGSLLCEPTGGTACDPGSMVLGGAGGPHTCAYGERCGSGSICVPAPVGSCTEASGTPSWSQALGTAPVITSASAVGLTSTNPSTECLNGDPAALVTLSFYAPNGLTSHTTFGDLTQHVRFKLGLNAGDPDYGVNFQRMLPPASAQFGTLEVGIGCGRSSGTAAMYLVDETPGNTSNVVCVVW